MKKILAGLLCLFVMLPFSGCSDKDAQTPSGSSDKAAQTTSGSSDKAAQTPSVSSGKDTQTPSGSSDIILDIREISNASGNALVSGTLVSDVSIGAEVQLVGVGNIPLSAKVTAIEVSGSAQDKAQVGQSAALTLDASAADLADMQRVVVAKHKKESELASAKTFDDVLGTLDGTVYQNKTFGFTMSSENIGFSPSLNPQEGFRVSFESTEAFYDFDIFKISSPDYNAGVTLYVSNVQAIEKETAAEQLAYEYSQYELTPDNLLLADKEAVHVQLKEDIKTTDCYAMIINGYYIRWAVTDKTGAYKDQLAEIMGSLTFDWVQE